MAESEMWDRQSLRVRIVCELFRITRSKQFRSVHLPSQDFERIQTIQAIYENSGPRYWGSNPDSLSQEFHIAIDLRVVVRPAMRRSAGSIAWILEVLRTPDGLSSYFALTVGAT
jgi:hypothetical protein